MESSLVQTTLTYLSLLYMHIIYIAMREHSLTGHFVLDESPWQSLFEYQLLPFILWELNLPTSQTLVDYTLSVTKNLIFAVTFLYAIYWPPTIVIERCSHTSFLSQCEHLNM